MLKTPESLVEKRIKDFIAAREAAGPGITDAVLIRSLKPVSDSVRLTVVFDFVDYVLLVNAFVKLMLKEFAGFGLVNLKNFWHCASVLYKVR